MKTETALKIWNRLRELKKSIKKPDNGQRLLELEKEQD